MTYLLARVIPTIQGLSTYLLAQESFASAFDSPFLLSTEAVLLDVNLTL